MQTLIQRFKQHSHYILAKDMLSYGVIHAVMRIVPFIVLPILTHLLSPQSIGKIEIVMSVFSILLATVLTFQQGYFRFYFSDSKDLLDQDVNRDVNLDNPSNETIARESRHYTFFRFYLFLSLSVVLLLLLLTSVGNRYGFIEAQMFWPTILASLAVLPSVLLRFMLGNLRLQREIQHFASLSLLDAVLKGGGTLLIIWGLGWDIEGYFLAFLIASLISTGFCFKHYFPAIHRGAFHGQLLQQAIQFSLPLLPAVLLTSLGQYIGRFFTASALDWRDVAILAIALKLALIAKLLSQAFNFAWQTLSVKYISDPKGDEFYAKTLSYFVVTALIIVVIVSFLSPVILSVFFPPEYAESARYVPFLAATILILSATSIVEMGAKIGKKTQWILWSHLLGLLANTGFLLFFIEDFGILAVALAGLFHRLISFWVQYLGSQKIHRISYSRYSLVGLSLLFPGTAQTLYYLIHGRV